MTFPKVDYKTNLDDGFQLPQRVMALFLCQPHLFILQVLSDRRLP